jgi:hypothetical protein
MRRNSPALRPVVIFGSTPLTRADLVDVTSSPATASQTAYDELRSYATAAPPAIPDTSKCQMAYNFDVWLTKDEVAGIADRRATDPPPTCPRT